MTAATHPNAPARKDNLLGICHAIGSDFGFNPLYLRILLAVGLLLDARIALAAYALAGLLVVASRLLVRRPRTGARTPAADAARDTASVPAPYGYAEAA